MPIHSNIPLMFAEVLYQAVLAQQPLAIEVEMAFGVASLAVLTALCKLGGNRQLISIRSNQSTGAAVALVKLGCTLRNIVDDGAADKIR